MNAEFSKRRKTFLQKIKGGVAIFPAAPHSVRNDDVHYDFRQDSNLYYLTAFPEPDCLGLFNPQHKFPFQLFVHPKDPLKELWEGNIIGPDNAKSIYGADFAVSSSPSNQMDEAIIEALCGADRVYYRLGLNPDWDQKLLQLMRQALRKLGRTGRGLWPIIDPKEILGEMRVIKSKFEIERLAKATQISAEAHLNAMKRTEPGMHEYEIQAIVENDFRIRGAQRVGYGSIVASGQNACILHYVENNRKMENGELLLIDAGAEFEYYTGDITRTFPVGKQFTPAQKEVYQAVLNVQKECIKLVKPGLKYRAIHECAVEGITEELKKLKVLSGNTATLIKNKSYFEFFPHGTGHWLGMDVHDSGKYYAQDYSEPRKIEAGMVFTIEPGLYFGKQTKGPARYHGIGVRIEDNIVVTDNGCKVLTSAAPKEVDEIEDIRGSI